MITGKLERRYAKIRIQLTKLLSQVKTLTPAEEKRWSRLEAELCEVERKLLTRNLVIAS